MNFKQLKSGVFAIGDQAIISITNAVAGLAVIMLSDKLDYATYALLFSAILLVQGVQMALINSPYTTVVNQTERRDYHRTHTARLSLFFSFLAGLIGVAIYYSATLVGGVGSNHVGLIAFVFAVVGVTQREAVRAIYYADKVPERAFRNNLFFCLISSLIGGFCYLWWEVTSTTLLLSFGLAGIICGTPVLVRWSRQMAMPLAQIYGYFKSHLLGSGRWALKGAAITWVNTNSYNYLASAFFGALVVADLAASRLYWMPLALLIAGWSSVFRPYISRWFIEGNYNQTKRLILLSSLLAVAIVGLYQVLIHFAHRVLLDQGLPAEYSSAGDFLTIWGVFFLLAFVRSAFGAALMVIEEGYKQLSRIAVIGLLTLVGSIPIIVRLDPAAILYALVAIEAVQLSISILLSRRFLGGHKRAGGIEGAFK